MKGKNWSSGFQFSGTNGTEKNAKNGRIDPVLYSGKLDPGNNSRKLINKLFLPKDISYLV